MQLLTFCWFLYKNKQNKTGVFRTVTQKLFFGGADYRIGYKNQLFLLSLNCLFIHVMDKVLRVGMCPQGCLWQRWVVYGSTGSQKKKARLVCADINFLQCLRYLTYSQCCYYQWKVVLKLRGLGVLWSSVIISMNQIENGRHVNHLHRALN